MHSCATHAQRRVGVSRCGGRYIVAHIPTFVDKNTANGTETYTYDAEKKEIAVKFRYTNLEGTKESCVDQTATVPLGSATAPRPYNAMRCDRTLRGSHGSSVPRPYSCAHSACDCRI